MTPNISFVPGSSKRSATMLDPFAQLFQHRWDHARSLRMVYKNLWVASFPRYTAGPNIVGSCCIRLHTTANTHAALRFDSDARLLLLNTCKHFVRSPLRATSAREHFTYSGTTLIGSPLLWHPCLISIYYSLFSKRRS